MGTFEGCGSIPSEPGEHPVTRGSAGDGRAGQRSATGDHTLRSDCPHRIAGGGRGNDGVPLCGLERESGVERQPVSVYSSAGGRDGGRTIATLVTGVDRTCWLERRASPPGHRYCRTGDTPLAPLYSESCGVLIGYLRTTQMDRLR